ncbi:MAG: VOC family protein [Myxococcales bacterium]|nr:VOC family protein [Myxococcales bacterium]
MSESNTIQNRVVWLDIPVADLDRACRFYRGVLAIDVHRESYGDYEFAVLDHQEGNGGCLVPDAARVSAECGPLVYLNVDGRIRAAIAQVSELGGRITEALHPIGPHGWRALIVDSEGNRMALHSSSDA